MISDLTEKFLPILACIWGAVAIALFVYLNVSSWIWARRNPPSEPIVREVHDGSGCVPGFMACMMWPLLIPLAIYDKWRDPPQL